MPELPPFKPQVSVFHFTSKVSSAKIAKYRQATERGMVLKEGSKGLDSVVGDEQMEDAQNSAKRPRLKINVREPKDTAGDTIAVSRPRRSTAGKHSRTNRKKREWSAAFSDDDEEAAASTPRSQASAANSSDLSSCDSKLIAEHKSSSERESLPGAVEGYGDFMSYYVQDDDEDKPVETTKVIPPASEKAKPAAKASKLHSPAATAQVSKASAGVTPPLQHKQQSPSQHNRQPQYSRPPTVAPVAIEIRDREPDTVAVMIDKLDALSTALTDFGGVPEIPQSPEPPGEDDSTVDIFLAMFGGDEAPQPPSAKKTKLPKRFEDLAEPGTQDLSLAHGIQFIMNALKSWAESRLHAQRLQMLQNAANVRRGSGRPVEIQAHSLPFMTPLNLFETPEGRAIQAFRAVVESGCLRVNTILPLQLARALRRLYMQIDHLINQTGKSQAPWRCLSYNAQIEANRIRVDKHKEAQVKAQEDMIRQQQINHQQTMRSMGLPDHLTSTMFYHQSQDAETQDYSGRGPNPDLVLLPTDPSTRPDLAHRSSGPYPHGGAPGQGQTGKKPGETAFLPRSGQSMKFSFAPSSDTAIKAFGAQSFPVSATQPIKREQTASATPIENVPPSIRLAVEEPSTSPVVISSGFSAVNKPRKHS